MNTNNIALKLVCFSFLLLFIASCNEQEKRCDLPISLQFGPLSINYNPKWNEFKFKNTQTLMYRYEGDWENRDEAEIDFIAFENSRLNENNFSQFVRVAIEGAFSSQSSKFDLEISEPYGKEFANLKWKTIDASISSDAPEEPDNVTIQYFFTSKDDYKILIYTRLNKPELTNVKAEMDCILNNIRFINQ